jgi:hypothetical protein
MSINYAQINLRDQIRKGETIPLQFTYEAANCRIFYTPQTFYNYENLWKYAADAIWNNPALCVQNSTGYATTNGSDTAGPPADIAPPSAAAVAPPVKLGSVIMSVLDGPPTEQTTLHDATGSTHKKSTLGSSCSTKNPCFPSSEWYCYPQYVSCVKGKATKPAPGCVKTCFPVGDYCGGNNNCKPFLNTTRAESIFKHQDGFCPPAPAPCQKTGSSGIPGKYAGGGGG